MARYVRWRCSFLSQNGTSCRVDIYSTGSGSATAVTGADNPFYCEEDDDENLLSPIRVKSGYINLVETYDGELDAIYPNTDFDRYVKVYYGSDVIFNGYIQAQAFENPHAQSPKVISFPVISPLGLLSSKDFTTKSVGNVALSTLLSEVMSGLDADISSYDFPYITKGSRTVTLSDIVSTLVVSPFNKDYNCLNTEDLYKPISYYDFMESLCLAFGVMVHDEYGKFVFVSPDDTYSNMVLTNLFTLADADGTESLVRPVKEVVISGGGDSLDDIQLSFKHTKKVWKESNVIDNKSYCVYFFEPVTDEISAGTFVNSCSIDTSGVLDMVGTAIISHGNTGGHFPGTGTADTSTMTDRKIVMVTGSSTEWVKMKFYEHPTDGILELACTAGRNLVSLDVAVAECGIEISCNGMYWNDGAWTSTQTALTKAFTNGSILINIADIPLNYPLEVKVWTPYIYASGIHFCIDGVSMQQTTLSDILPWYDVKETTDMKISCANAPESVSIQPLFSYAIKDTHMITDDDGADTTAAHVTSYSYMSTSQQRLKARFKCVVRPSGPYTHTYTYNNVSYHILAMAEYPWDDEVELTLQTF